VRREANSEARRAGRSEGPGNAQFLERLRAQRKLGKILRPAAIGSSADALCSGYAPSVVARMLCDGTNGRRMAFAGSALGEPLTK
jgi:hypothetical protein